MIEFASVLLPEPFGPISACTSPPFTTRSTPFKISLPSTLTCSPSMAKVGCVPPFLFDMFAPLALVRVRGDYILTLGIAIDDAAHLAHRRLH